MQNLHVLLALAQHVRLQDVGILHTLILHQIRETFTLHTCHVKDISIGNRVLREVALLDVVDIVLLAVELILLWHLQFLRCDKVECWVILPHRHQQRVYRATILQVAHHIDVQVLQRTLCLVNGVEVEHRL